MDSPRIEDAIAAPPVISAPLAAAPPVAKRPPVWPSLLMLVTGPIAATTAAAIALVVFVLATNRADMSGLEDAARGIAEGEDTSLTSILAITVPSQLAFALSALGIALLAHGRSSLRSLGLVRWNAPHATILLALVGTLGVAFAITIATSWMFEEPSESVKQLWRIMSAPQGAAGVAVVLLFSIFPGLCEETLFRGAQAGLSRRWHPVAAIGLVSFVFALVHGDVQRSIAVLPLGAWFGWLAWKTGSTWTSVLCHFVNNSVAITVGRIWGDSETGDFPENDWFYGIGVLLLVCTVATWFAVRRLPGRAAS